MQPRLAYKLPAPFEDIPYNVPKARVPAII